MLIVVTDFGYKESDSCARKLSLSVSAHEPLKHLKRSKECLLHSKGTTIYNILRAMLCQEIGPAQGTEQIPSECLWTWLCKGCNSKSLTNDDKRLRYVEKLEVICSPVKIAGDWSYHKFSDKLFEYFLNMLKSFSQFSNLFNLFTSHLLLAGLAFGLCPLFVSHRHFGHWTHVRNVDPLGVKQIGNVRSSVDVNICQSTSIIVK